MYVKRFARLCTTVECSVNLWNNTWGPKTQKGKNNFCQMPTVLSFHVISYIFSFIWGTSQSFSLHEDQVGHCATGFLFQKNQKYCCWWLGSEEEVSVLRKEGHGLAGSPKMGARDLGIR